MGKQTVNSKAVAAKEKKAAHQAKVDAKKRAEEDAIESSEWAAGAKGRSKKDDEAEKKAQARARKLENDALLAAEEREVKAKKVAKGPKLDPDNPLMVAAAKKKTTNAPLRGADKVAAKKAEKVEQKGKEIEKFGSARSSSAAEEFGASNIDDALDLLNVATSSSSGPQAANLIERHPERRAKAAYKAYEEAMLPELRKENPSLRLTQVKELLWKMWQKAPENPFNQEHISHDTAKGDEREIVEKLRQDTESRLRIK